jgi:hypothetical protein
LQLKRGVRHHQAPAQSSKQFPCLALAGQTAAAAVTLVLCWQQCVQNRSAIYSNRRADGFCVLAVSCWFCSFRLYLQDRSFTFILKTPPTAVLLKKAAGGLECHALTSGA